MATVSILSAGEKVALPFCVLIPLSVGALGYWLWKREHGETLSVRLSAWFMASSAITIGLTIFHVIFNITGMADPRVGLAGLSIAFCACMCLKMHFELAWIENEDLYIINADGETSDFVILNAHDLRQAGPALNNSHRNTKRRRAVALITYAVIVFQSAFDGLVLKYNPNGNDSGVQVAMFFISKALESVVVCTALIHAAVKTRNYLFCICCFTVSVGLSTLAAYEFVSPSAPITIFEHWVFQICLGASGGVLLVLSFYYAYLESRRTEAVDRTPTKTIALNGAFTIAFVASVLTGLFG